MNDNPNIFFVVLTGPRGPIAANIADIKYVYPGNEGSAIVHLRDTEGTFFHCNEPADEVARKIHAVLLNTLVDLARSALKAVGQI